MKTALFDTSALPRDKRLSAFRAGAIHYRVDPLGPVDDFAVAWTLLTLGDVNVIRAKITPVHYERTAAMIHADREDRLAVHLHLKGHVVGELDGIPFKSGPGGAVVWDLSRTIKSRSEDILETFIVTLPRFMLDEVLKAPVYCYNIAPSPEVRLILQQATYLFDNADNLPDEASVSHGYIIRDLVAIAIEPALIKGEAGKEDLAIFQRLRAVIDSNLQVDLKQDDLAIELAVDADTLRREILALGGLPKIVERRRLIAAYRLLSDNAELDSVSAIAWRCGFNDIPRFNVRFRDMFGVSPSSLRAKRSGDLPEWAGAYRVEINYKGLAVK